MVKFLSIFLFILLFIGEGTHAQKKAEASGRVIRIFKVINARAINSISSDFAPVPFNNGIVFTSSREINMINYGENKMAINNHLSILHAEYKLKDGKEILKKPTLFSANLDLGKHNGPICFNAEGTVCFYTRVDYQQNRKDTDKKNPQLYVSQKKGSDWAKSVKLPFCKPAYAYGHPSFSVDGNTLYFCSNMPDGYGGNDIYKVVKTDGEWGKPENLGPQINSKDDELFPHIALDGTLYFSSNRPESFGKLDLFSSIQKNGKWRHPFNLGSTINTAYDDFAMHFDKSGKSGWFSSTRPGSSGADDIYVFVVREEFNIDHSLIAGKFVFEKGASPDNPSGIKVSLLNDKGEVIMTTITDKEGSFIFGMLPSDEYYIIKLGVEDEGMMAHAKIVMNDEKEKEIAVVVMNANKQFAFTPIDCFSPERLARMTNKEQEEAIQIINVNARFSYVKLPKKTPTRTTVYLADENGKVLMTTTLDENGEFSFDE